MFLACVFVLLLYWNNVCVCVCVCVVFDDSLKWLRGEEDLEGKERRGEERRGCEIKGCERQVWRRKIWKVKFSSAKSSSNLHFGFCVAQHLLVGHESCLFVCCFVVSAVFGVVVVVAPVVVWRCCLLFAWNFSGSLVGAVRCFVVAVVVVED